MANATLAEARTLVAQDLDDPNNRRWTTAQIDVGLQGALSSCLSQYITAGGNAFDLDLSVTTASTGIADLTSVAPILFIKTVQIVTGSSPALTYTNVTPTRKGDRFQTEPAVYTLALIYVRDYRIPTTTSHPLVGVGATEAASWPDFDQWVCAEAALRLGVKDNDKRPGLEAYMERARKAVLERLNTPRAYPLTPPNSSPQIWRRLSFTFTNSSTAPSIALVRSTSEGWQNWGGWSGSSY